MERLITIPELLYIAPMRTIYVIYFLFSFTFLSCNSGENEKLIIGTWAGSEWLVDGKASNLNAAQTTFTFSEDRKYTFDYAGTKEEGSFKVENDMLFTTPLNEREIMVKINKLTKDSLVFEMNRGGRPEQLTLLRK